MKCIPRIASDGDFAVCRDFDRHLPDGLLHCKLSAGDVVLADADGQAQGYLRLEYLWGTVPYIGLVYVREPLRGGGIGTAMLSFVEQTLRCAGQTALYSSSQADDAASQAWHRRSGFVECGMIAGINDGGGGEVFFRKSLV